MHVADMKILQLKPVQKEIGLSEAQRSQMNVAADAERSQAQAEYKRTSGKPDPKKMRVYYGTLRVKVFAILTSGQLHRLAQLTLQETGLVALADQEVATAVGLSSGQLKKIRDTIVNQTKAFDSAEGSAKRPIFNKYKGMKPKNKAEGEALQKQFTQELQAADAQLRPQVRAIMKKGTADILGILTPDQKAKWKQILGKTFVPSR